MIRRHWLRLLASAAALRLVPSASAFVQAGPEAADVYRRAFAWSRSVDAEWSAVREALRADELPPAQVRHWLKAARPALAELREAATIDACRWGDEAMTSEDLGRDRFDASHHHLINLARLSAIRKAEAGRFEGALDDAFAALTLARRIGDDGPLIARLFQCGGEIATHRTLGRVLPLLDRPALGSLLKRLDAAPPPAPASATIGPESRFILNTLRAHLATMGDRLSDEDWTRLDLEEEAPALKRLTGGERARLLARLDASAPAFAELGRRLDLPRDRRDAALDDFAATRRETDPIAAGLVEPSRAFPNAIERARFTAETLRAGLVLVRDGEDGFQALRDPFGAGPFGLERRGDGWWILSALPDGEAPTSAFAIGRPSPRRPSRLRA